MLLTAIVLAPLWRGGKKNASTGRRVAYQLKKEKCSRFYQSTLRIKDFKYGPSFSIFVKKNNEAQRSQVSQFLPLDNNKTAEFDSGISYQGIEGQKNR